MSRRAALRLLAGATGTAALAACGAGPTAAPADLAFAVGEHSGARLSAILRKSFVGVANDLIVQQSNAWSQAADAFIEVRILDDWREAYTQVADRRYGDDIAELFGTAPHIYSDRLADVSDVAEELAAGFGGWTDAARDAGMVDGVWRAIPWLYTALGLNYREDHLEAAGLPVPETYDELLHVATTLADQGLPRVGFSMGSDAPNDSANLAYSLLWSFGGQEVDESGKRVTLDSAATRRALEYFRELSRVSHPDAPAYGEATNNSAFLSSDISMTQNASSIYWRALQDAPDIAAAMNHVRYPSGPAGHHQLVELNSLAIFERTRHLDAAKDWMRFMLQPEQLRPRAEASLSFFTPSLLAYADDAEMPWNTDPKLQGMQGDQASGHLPGWPGPASVESGLVYENGTLTRMFRAAGERDVSIDEAVSVGTEELRRVYET